MTKDATFLMLQAFFAEAPLLVRVLMLGGFGGLFSSLVLMFFCFLEEKIGEAAVTRFAALSYLFFYIGVFLIIVGGLVIWILAMYTI